MNSTRETLIVRADFASSGSKFDEAAWNHRKQTLLKNLHIQLPMLRELRASYLKLEYEIVDGRAYMRVLLQESPQISLPNLSTRPGGQNLYLQELHMIREQQASLPERIQQALRSFHHPAQDPELAELRHLLWRSRADGYLQMHSSAVGEVLCIPQLPHSLPNATRVVLAALIYRISRTEVRVQILNDLTCPVTNDQIFSIGAKVNLFRRRSPDNVAIGLQLAASMEHEKSIHLNVEIEYSWLDGRPQRLTLLALR